MASLKRFGTPQEFLEYNNETFSVQYFEHYHLHDLFDNYKSGRDNIYEACNIIDQDGSDVIIVWATQRFFIYSSKWNNDILNILATEFNHVFRNEILLRGQKKLILELKELLKLKCEVINDRNIYHCVSLRPLNRKVKGKFGIAGINDAQTIINLSVKYYDEEFEGKGQKSQENVKQSAYQGVLNSSTFKWSYNGRIVTIARLLNTEPSNAMIGGLYTKINERNRGYAHFLLSELTNHLFDKGVKKCGLLTEATKKPTNKIFENVGYVKVYEWVNVFNSKG